MTAVSAFPYRTTTGTVLVLFILLVIITRSLRWP
jgi:hypothetical protein